MRVAGKRVESAPVQTEAETVELPFWVDLLCWIVRKLGQLVVWAWRHPVFSGVVLVVAFVWQLIATLGSWIIPATVLPTVAALTWWYKASPESFRSVVVARVKGAWRALVCYRPGWDGACEAMALVKVMRGDRYLPRLVKVRSLGAVDVATVEILPGQTLDDWMLRADALAHTFDAISCRMTPHPDGPRGTLDLRFLAYDPFANPVPVFEQSDDVDLRALPVAWCEDGNPFRVRIQGRHFLLVGESGSGKSSAMQALLYGLAPAVGSGLVALHPIDMKGGVELSHVAGLSTSFVYENPQGACDLLERLDAEVMKPRLKWMRRHQVREHTPTVDEPLHVVPIDELAAITAYVDDGPLKKKINGVLSRILSQGRAAGVVVIAGVQDGRKSVVDMRGLFTYRIAFRLNDASEVDMVLSKGARNRGAFCDQISQTTPGVAFADTDGQTEPVRLRFPYLDDEAIAASTRRHAVGHGHNNVIALGADEYHTNGAGDVASAPTHEEAA